MNRTYSYYRIKVYRVICHNREIIYLDVYIDNAIELSTNYYIQCIKTFPCNYFIHNLTVKYV